MTNSWNFEISFLTLDMADANASPIVRPIGFDRQYVWTIPGKINLALVVIIHGNNYSNWNKKRNEKKNTPQALNAVSFISGIATFFWILGAKEWFCFVSGAGFWVDLFVVFVAIFRFEDRLNRFPRWKQGVQFHILLFVNWIFLKN